MQFATAFDPVAREIGHIARLWNALHENMATIFAGIFGTTRWGMAYAVWHSTPNDRAQRQMLKAANQAWAIHDGRLAGKAAPEIAWLVDEADKLSDMRNNVLHAPLSIFMDTSTWVFTVEPNTVIGNPRARKLKEMDLLTTFQRYREQIDCLNRYAMVLSIYVRSSTPLPERPRLPTFPQSMTRKNSPRKAPPT